MDPISEIKSRISIEDLVSQYIPLKKAGRHFKALCPFHNEKTPSFYVSPERQLAYCFGCRKGGDHFKFVEEIEGLDFKGALKLLAEKAGVELPKTTPQDKQKKSERDRLIEMHEVSARFYAQQLWNAGEGGLPLVYLKRRGVSDEIIKNAMLGFAPDSKDALFRHLLEKGFKREEILAGGLAFGSDFENTCVDRFRMRLMFPIHNLAGVVCAFGGRALAEGDEPKYLNSPETAIFHKRSFLYGLNSAKAGIRSKGEAVIVEGYMDALACHQAGFLNVAACGGTAVTEEQLAVIKRFSQDIVLALDRDSAGFPATERAIELALQLDLTVKVAVWAEGKDPDECIKKDPKIFETALKNAPAAMEYLIDSFAKEHNPATVLGKKKMVALLLPFLQKIKSAVELDGWIKKISGLADISAQAVYDELKKFQGFQPKRFVRESVEEKSTKNFNLQEYLCGIILTYPETISIANLFIKPEDFENIELQNIYRTLTTQYNQTLGANGNVLSEKPFVLIQPYLSDEEFNRANILSLYAESLIGDMNWDALEAELREIIFSFLKQKFAREKRSLVSRLKQAAGPEKNQLVADYQNLLAKEEETLGRLRKS